MLKVVVTGGAGFIGANLCRELAARPEVSRAGGYSAALACTCRPGGGA